MSDESNTKPGDKSPAATALKLVERGMHVFQIWGVTQQGACRCPSGAICKSPGKHPIHKGGFKNATNDPQTVLALAAESPEAQWAIACEASNIAVLDIDYRHGGAESLRAWEVTHGELPVTATVKTGNGMHHYFLRPAQGIRNSAGKLGYGLDMRGDGGYVVAPGSHHANGATYELEGDPDSLLHLAELPTELQMSWPTASQAGDAKSARGPDANVQEGGRNDFLASLAGKMRRTGCEQEAIEAALQVANRSRCAPPLDEAEVTAIANSISRYTPASQDEQLDDLARLPTIEYQRRRKSEAKDLGINVAILDNEIKERRQALASAAEQEALFPSVEPWPDQVDGDALLGQMVAALLQYLVISKHAALAIGLWALNTYVFRVFYFLPILVATSPDKRCGKSTLLALLARLVHRPLSTSNVSPAAIYRVVQKFHPTLLVDEADTFLPKNEELRGIINSGHTKSSASVVRCHGEQFDPRPFSTWTPKFIAQIGNPPDTIKDRSVVIEMRRKKKTEHVERLREDRADHLRDLQRQCVRWAQDNAERLEDADAAMPPGLNDRAEDNWRGMFNIADFIGGPWPEAARIAAVKLQRERDVEEEDNAGVLLLRDIYDIWQDDERTRLATAYILEALNAMEHRPWPEWGRLGTPMTPTQLAKQLAPFGIRPKTIRLGADYLPKGYERKQFDDAFERYLGVAPAATPQQAENHGEKQSATTAMLPFPSIGQKPKTTSENNGVAALRQEPHDQASSGNDAGVEAP